MADANRPRPRPRPKPKVNSGSIANAKASSSTTPHPSSPLRQIHVQDDDEMFMRNRKRTTKTWEALEKLDKKTKVISIDSDSDDEAKSPRPRKLKKFEKPSWQKDKDFVRNLSVSLSDDSDNDIEIVGMSTPKATQGGKRKRQRSRSRSITPPPALTLHQIQNARNVVRQTLDNAVRPPSPTHHEVYDSDDTVFSNPELAHIAKSIASRPREPSQAPTRASSVEVAETVTLSVKWQPHPLNEAGKEDLWVFKTNRDDRLHDLFEAIAEEAFILRDNLIVTYKGNLLYASSTPMTLKIWGEADLVACDTTTYEYLRKNPLATDQMLDPLTPHDLTSNTEASPPPSTSQDTDSGSDSEDDAFKLILRSSITTKDITLTVRPTTKCGAIVKAFLKKAGLADQYPGVFETDGGSEKKSVGRGKKGAQAPGKDPKLLVDGDKMGNDVEISEADLEDGDLVEVVGL